MFGLYPAGPTWTRVFYSEKEARVLQRDLTQFAGFTAGLFHKPFGEQRGAVFAQLDGLVVVVSPNDRQVAVTPDVTRQYLLWSDAKGYRDQWSAHELKSMTGANSWSDFLSATEKRFAEVCEFVAHALDGTLKAPVDEAPTPEVKSTDPDLALWEANSGDSIDAMLASHYFDHSYPTEQPSCGL
jgi:hypothetical protein